MGEQQGEVNFFGIKINVKNPKLAAVLNSSVTDDVATVAERVRTAEEAKSALAPAAGPAATPGPAATAGPAAGRAAGRIVVPLDPADRVSELPLIGSTSGSARRSSGARMPKTIRSPSCRPRRRTIRSGTCAPASRAP